MAKRRETSAKRETASPKPRMILMLFKPDTPPAEIVAALRKAAAKASPSSRR